MDTDRVFTIDQTIKTSAILALGVSMRGLADLRDTASIRDCIPIPLRGAV